MTNTRTTMVKFIMVNYYVTTDNLTTYELARYRANDLCQNDLIAPVRILIPVGISAGIVEDFSIHFCL